MGVEETLLLLRELHYPKSLLTVKKTCFSYKIHKNDMEEISGVGQ